MHREGRTLYATINHPKTPELQPVCAACESKIEKDLKSGKEERENGCGATQPYLSRKGPWSVRIRLKVKTSAAVGKENTVHILLILQK